MVAAAGEQAAVAVDVFDVAVVVRVDLPSAPLQTRMLFVVMVQTPIWIVQNNYIEYKTWLVVYFRLANVAVHVNKQQQKSPDCNICSP